MKKKKLKSLSLNKKVISKFNQEVIKGGATELNCPTHFTCPTGLPCDIVLSIANGTDGDCVDTWGDDGCLTGIKGLCIAQ